MRITRGARRSRLGNCIEKAGSGMQGRGQSGRQAGGIGSIVRQQGKLVGKAGKQTGEVMERRFDCDQNKVSCVKGTFKKFCRSHSATMDGKEMRSRRILWCIVRRRQRRERRRKTRIKRGKRQRIHGLSQHRREPRLFRQLDSAVLLPCDRLRLSMRPFSLPIRALLSRRSPHCNSCKQNNHNKRHFNRNG